MAQVLEQENVKPPNQPLSVNTSRSLLVSPNVSLSPATTSQAIVPDLLIGTSTFGILAEVEGFIDIKYLNSGVACSHAALNALVIVEVLLAT